MADITKIQPMGDSTQYTLGARYLTHTPNNTTTFLRGDNTWSDTLTATLNLTPPSGEGGEIHLNASTAYTTQNGIILDNCTGTFRIFGIPSADGTTKTGVGTPLEINPYNKTITGGYTITGTLNGNAATATALTSNAGSSTVPIYFSSGKPVQCSTTLGVNITGNAASASAVAWGNVTGKPSTFAPSSHNHSSITLSGSWNTSGSLFHVCRTEGSGSATNYDICFACSDGNRGAVIAVDWRGGSNNIYYNTKHDDSGNNNWQSWRRIWVQGNSVTSAVWNDYAEYREAEIIEPGYVLIEKGDDTLIKSTKRLQPYAGISSDTWGFAQGETETAKTPIAVAGRVLVYPYKNRNKYKPGMCVCTAPNGTIDIMHWWEKILYPDRIVGTVSCVPDYEKWGGGDGADRDPVKVNGRIWIKVR